MVLKSLNRPHFEPLHRSSLRDVTKKAFFLVALATAIRVGELQALSFSVMLQGHDLSCSYSRGSSPRPSRTLSHSLKLPPLQLPGNYGQGRRRASTISSQGVTVVPTLAASTTRPRHMFLSVHDTTRPCLRRPFPSFIGKPFEKPIFRTLPVLLSGSVSLTSGALPPPSYSGGIALSFHSRGRLLEDPFCFYGSHLRDIQRQEGDIFALGPVVAAGDIVH